MRGGNAVQRYRELQRAEREAARFSAVHAKQAEKARAAHESAQFENYLELLVSVHKDSSDASVPFRFDVHAILFSDDAVGIETALHQRFADRRVNFVNMQREFFHVTPHDVKGALMELQGNLLSFVETPEALEWHQSQTALRAKRAKWPRANEKTRVKVLLAAPSFSSRPRRTRAPG